jgi:hypothetical protein
MNDHSDTPLVRAFLVAWRDRAGILHASAPRFLVEEKARRFARLLRNDPAVVETRIMPVVMRPLAPPPDAA